MIQRCHPFDMTGLSSNSREAALDKNQKDRSSWAKISRPEAS